MTGSGSCMAIGMAMFACGIEEHLAILTICGVFLYCAGFVVGLVEEDRLKEKLCKFEKEIKEMKTNGKV